MPYTLSEVNGKPDIRGSRLSVVPLRGVHDTDALPQVVVEYKVSRGVVGLSALRDTDGTYTVLEVSLEKRMDRSLLSVTSLRDVSVPDALPEVCLE